MKHAFVVLGGVLLVTLLTLGPAWATDGLTPGGPCVTDPLSLYISVGNCTIGDKTFAGFGYQGSAVNLAVIPAADITVTPILTARNPGFTFTAPWSAVDVPTIQFDTIFYTVAVLPGGQLIDDASLALISPLADFGALVDVTETLCVGGGQSFAPPGACPSTSSVVLVHAFDNHRADPETIHSTDHVIFSPVGTINVRTDITLSNGLQIDTARLAGFTSQFSEVPEPGTLLLFGIGLGGLAAIGRRRR